MIGVMSAPGVAYGTGRSFQPAGGRVGPWASVLGISPAASERGRAGRNGAGTIAGPHEAMGVTTRPAGAPMAGGTGSWMCSIHRNSLRAPRVAISNVPVPRTTRPVCRSTHRCGGSHSVITIRSVNPMGPTPVHPVTSAPGPRPPLTRVAQIHSRWRGQSVAVRQISSGSASTVTSAAIRRGVGMAPGYLSPRPVADRPGRPPAQPLADPEARDREPLHLRDMAARVHHDGDDLAGRGVEPDGERPWAGRAAGRPAAVAAHRAAGRELVDLGLQALVHTGDLPPDPHR